MEALLYKEQDLLRFVNNLVVISKLLLYVRACGMPYKRDETPNRSEKSTVSKTVLLSSYAPALMSVDSWPTKGTEKSVNGIFFLVFKRFMQYFRFFLLWDIYASWLASVKYIKHPNSDKWLHPHTHPHGIIRGSIKFCAVIKCQRGVWCWEEVSHVGLREVICKFALMNILR